MPGARFLKLAATTEGFIAGTGNNDNINIIVLIYLGANILQLLSQLEVDTITGLRAVQGYIADMVFFGIDNCGTWHRLIPQPTHLNQLVY